MSAFLYSQLGGKTIVGCKYAIASQESQQSLFRLSELSLTLIRVRCFLWQLTNNWQAIHPIQALKVNVNFGT